eukprot:jgi/Chrzof1/8962/Cz03g31040.t1
MSSVKPLAVLLLVLTLLFGGCSPVHPFEAKPYALVVPVPSSSRLALAEEGLQVLSSITQPIAPVVVIGPYRSGKSFLLNQMLHVPCDTGFGVGHTRETQTKGIWVWGEPQLLSNEQGEVQKALVFVDTEGFESTGRSNSYDDRIFAVAAVLSSLLIYNLPETIRESDVSKLSFAVDLAAGFYDNYQGSQGVPVQPGSMLWLIQRDFLEGKSVQQLVKDALAPVPNPSHDMELDALNKIRASLASIAGNSTGYSLPQPHLERTHLCKLNDSQLEPAYVRQRDRLNELVHQLARPKVVGNQAFTGAQLADLIKSLVNALNAKEIPTAASLIESFNSELINKAMQEYNHDMDTIKLPIDEQELEKADATARGAALRFFQDKLLGRRQGTTLKEQLIVAIDKEHKARATANIAESNTVCQQLEMKCERLLDAASGVQLVSMHKFEDGFKKCQQKFEAACVGPGRAGSLERLQSAWKRAHGQFAKDYNDRLFTGLLVSSLVVIVVFRFLIKSQFLEAGGWFALVFLELYPRLYPGPGGMYDTAWWKVTTQVWELCMYALFGFQGAPLLWVLLGAAVYFIWRRVKRRDLRKKFKQTAGDLRDLDV